MRDKTYWLIYNRVRRKYPKYSKKQCGIITTKIFNRVYSIS